jgi:hypothetical protein
MVVKKSFAFRVVLLANSIAAYDQLLFARFVSSSADRLHACLYTTPVMEGGGIHTEIPREA